MLDNGLEVGALETWVDLYYCLIPWKEIHSYKIEPINWRSMWLTCNYLTTIIPPNHHRQDGWPKKKSTGDVDEWSNQSQKLSRRYMTVTCSKSNNKVQNSKCFKG
uniref:Uncharacterized protein n=1 Tax=Lactuca sativa TaxID=4236 RepID=A0A9R1W241_LACSA|nr:hypothetical protein LSAT_V11C300146320 [Lactuca sativa]